MHALRGLQLRTRGGWGLQLVSILHTSASLHVPYRVLQAYEPILFVRKQGTRHTLLQLRQGQPFERKCDAVATVSRSFITSKDVSNGIAAEA